jgi:transketolase
MRATFIKTLTALAEVDPRIFLLTGDLGFMALEPFAQRFPARFLNMGVAEQNMVGVATGMAEAGYLPFVYSIVNFAVLRPYEFIRNGPVLQRLPVRIVGVGGGMEYGTNGTSHYGLEDIGVLRMLPGLRVLAPADAQQAASALQATWNDPSPVYYRLGKDDRPRVPGLDGRFESGRIQVLKSGTQVAMLSTGAISVEAAAAAKELNARGISCGLAIVADLNPCPTQEISGFIGETPLVVTIESHFRTGGLGSMVAEVATQQAMRCRLIRLGFDGLLTGLTGSQPFMQGQHGLNADQVVETVSAALLQPLGATHV